MTMHTQNPYPHLHIMMLVLGLVLQTCGRPNQELGNIETPRVTERPITTTHHGLYLYGPFVTASGTLVTLQQKENVWTAKVQETEPLVREQQLLVGCAENIAKMLSRWQYQPADYVKSRIHVLSPTQSPTGQGVVYLGKVGLSGGMDQDEPEGDISSLPSLHQAARAGNLAAVKNLLERGNIDVNIIDNEKKTVLHRAAQGGNLAVIQYLVEKKNADVDAKDYDKRTVLHCAAEAGHLPVIKYFVEEKQADVNVCDEGNVTALQLAAEQGHLAVIKYLVEEKNADINARDAFEKTALHFAAEAGHLAVIQYLVEEKNADVNALDDGDNTVLHLAAEKGHLAVVQYLVEEKEADVNASNNWGMTVLHCATRESRLETIQYLLEKGADLDALEHWGRTVLHLAAEAGNLGVVKYFVEERGADINARAIWGRTMLHCAAEDKNLAVLKYLVEEKNMDVNTVDVFQRTAFHSAARGGHLAVIKYLAEEQNVDVDTPDSRGATPLHWAAENGHLEVIKYLIEQQSVDIDTRNNNGATALHWTAYGGYLTVVKYLVEDLNADVNGQDNKGASTLHYATRGGHLGTIKYLLEEQEVDVNFRDNNGKTALHYAAEEGRLDVVKYFVEEQGINLNAQDNTGKTALHWAAEEGQLEIILYLMEEANGFHTHQIIRDPGHECFEQWENLKLYAQLTTLANMLYSKEGAQVLRPEEISTIKDASLKFKLACKEQDRKPRKECSHDLVTAFRNRFNNRIQREGVPEAMLLDPEAYFKDIQLPNSLETERQALINLINTSRGTYLLHTSSLVALLERSEEISSTPLSFILCPPGNFRSYDPEDLMQRRTVEFYAQRSTKLARLVENAENVNRDLSPAEIEVALCKYLGDYLLQLEPHTELIEAVQEDNIRKDLIVNQIESMLIEDEVLLPVGVRAKLKRFSEALQTPSTS